MRPPPTPPLCLDLDMPPLGVYRQEVNIPLYERDNGNGFSWSPPCRSAGKTPTEFQGCLSAKLLSLIKTVFFLLLVQFIDLWPP